MDNYKGYKMTKDTPSLEDILDNVFKNLEVSESGLLFPESEHRAALKTAINQYILAEILELIGPFEKEVLDDGSGYDEEMHIRNALRQQLRAKAQERFGV